MGNDESDYGDYDSEHDYYLEHDGDGDEEESEEEQEEADYYDEEDGEASEEESEDSKGNKVKKKKGAGAAAFKKMQA